MNGEVRGAKGMFPADFVDSVPGDLPKAGKEEKDASKEESKPKVSVCVCMHAHVCTVKGYSEVE